MNVFEGKDWDRLLWGQPSPPGRSAVEKGVCVCTCVCVARRGGGRKATSEKKDKDKRKRNG